MSTATSEVLVMSVPSRYASIVPVNVFVTDFFKYNISSHITSNIIVARDFIFCYPIHN